MAGSTNQKSKSSSESMAGRASAPRRNWRRRFSPLTEEHRMTSKTPQRPAAILTAPNHIEIQKVPLPEPAAGQVRVRLEGCGVCGSNLPPWEGRPWFTYPFPPGAPGHEGWGEVDMLGANVTKVAVGDRVAILSYNAYAEYDL